MIHRSDLASTRWSWLAGGSLIGLAGVCWALSAVRMNGMDAGPGGDLGAAAWFIPTWLVMMAAMMLPVIAAAVVRRDAGGAERAVVERTAATVTFIAGYLTVWGVVGLLVYELLSVARSVAGEAFVWNRAGRWLAGALLASAAAYQLTGPKRRALMRCRHSNRSRPSGLAGLRAGIDCLSSSCLMMASLFGLGAMSLWWMAVVAVLIGAERLAPAPAPGRLAAACVFLALALGVAIAPASVPGLTVPGRPAAMRAMARMSP